MIPTRLMPMGRGGKRLPYDAGVEYLESTGTQWINSGIIGAPDVIVEATFAWGDGAFKADNTLIGSNTGSSRFIPITTNNQSGVEIGTGSSWTFAADSIKYAKNTVYTAWSEFVSGAIKFILDGTQVISTTKAISNTNLVMYIFASHESSAGRRAHAKLYSMKIYQNGAIVSDFIPVRVGSVGCLYDQRGVGGMNPDGSARNDGLYYNRGTGAFVVGPDK